MRFKNHAPGSTVSVWHALQFSIMGTIDPLSLLDIPYVIGGESGTKVEEINDALYELNAAENSNLLLIGICFLAASAAGG